MRKKSVGFTAFCSVLFSSSTIQCELQNSVSSNSKIYQLLISFMENANLKSRTAKNNKL